MARLRTGLELLRQQRQAVKELAEGLGIFDRSGSRYASLKEDWWPLLEFARIG